MDEETTALPETVLTHARPMIYVTSEVSMDSAEIGDKIVESLKKLGAFIGAGRVDVSGPPHAVYRDYTKAGMTMDVGFPVSAPALAMATGEFRAGTTPSGRALKRIHRGSYQTLRESFGEIEAYCKEQGIEMAPVCWEVYRNNPEETPEEDLITEIFVKLSV